MAVISAPPATWVVVTVCVPPEDTTLIVVPSELPERIVSLTEALPAALRLWNWSSPQPPATPPRIAQTRHRAMAAAQGIPRRSFLGLCSGAV